MDLKATCLMHGAQASWYRSLTYICVALSAVLHAHVLHAHTYVQTPYATHNASDIQTGKQQLQAYRGQEKGIMWSNGKALASVLAACRM